MLLQSAVQTKDDEDFQQPVQQSYKHTVEPIKPTGQDNTASGGSRQAMLYVRMESTDGGVASSEGTASSSGGQSDIVEDEVWYDCAEGEAEWFDAAVHRSSQASDTTAGQSAHLLTPEQSACLEALPPQLRSLLTKYLQVSLTALLVGGPHCAVVRPLCCG